MIKRALIILATLVALTGLAAVPAQAAVSDCIVPRVCVWINPEFSGAPAYYWTIPTGSGGMCLEFGGSLNDNVDSAVIKGGRSATLYEHGGCGGQAVFFLARPAYGGPETGKCNQSVDNWACTNFTSPGKLPSSIWVIKHS